MIKLTKLFFGLILYLKMKRTKAQVIIASDPSVTAWGWAAININTGLVVGAGCVKTQPLHKKLRIRKGDDTARRISEINDQFLILLKRYDVKYFVSELPHGSQSASAAVMIGIVTGIMQTISDITGIGLEWFSEGDAKLCLLGKRSAIKTEMVDAIGQLYKMPYTGVMYKDEAMADAMSIYHTARKTSDVFRLFKLNL